MAAYIKFKDSIEYASSEIKNEIGNNDSVQFLPSQKRYMEINIIIPHKEDKIKQKMKIKNEKLINELVNKISKDYRALIKEYDEIRNNKELMLALMNYPGIEPQLEYVSEELQNDKEIVLTAIKKTYILVLQHASKELKNDKDVVLTAIERNGYVLEHASDNLKNDKKIILAAIQNNGFALRFASDNLQNNKEIVLIACLQNKKAIKYASSEIKNEIGNNDPVQFLQSQKRYMEINSVVPHKEDKIKQKIKI